MRKIALLVLSVSLSVSAQDAVTGPYPSASKADIAHLRSTVLPDLKKALSTVLGSGYSEYSAADMEYEYKRCVFEYVSLNSLGVGIRVSWNGLKAPNSPFIGLYVKRGNGFQRLYTGSGFGPEVIKGRKIPDLVVGDTSGSCSETLERLRFNGAVYKPNACIQRTVKNTGDCVAMKCTSNLPMFPDPDPEP
jgi:hypothetical protein